MFQAEGWEHWIKSQARWDALGDATKPVIVRHLQDCNIDFKLSKNASLVLESAKKIWSKFVDDHLRILPEESAVIAPLYSLTQNYVRLVGSRLERSGELNSTLLSSQPKPTKSLLGEPELKSLIMKRVKKLQYDYFPLIKDSTSAVEGVCDKVWERLLAMSSVIHPEDLSNAKIVATILNDMEDQSAYLSTINQLFRIRVCLSDVIDPSVASLDASSFLLGSRSSANESDPNTKVSPGSSKNKAGKRSLASSDCSSIVHSAKRSKTSNTTTSNTKQAYNAASESLTLMEMGRASCGNCILCNMPDCERCFACSDNKNVQDMHSMKCCIRKVSGLFSMQDAVSMK